MKAVRIVFPVLASVALIALAGCDKGVPAAGKEFEVSGKVTPGEVKDFKGLTLFFQPTGGNAQQAQFPIKDGKFSGRMVVGKYTYFLTGSEADLKKVPEKFRSGSLDRQIDVNEGSPLDIKF